MAYNAPKDEDESSLTMEDLTSPDKKRVEQKEERLLRPDAEDVFELFNLLRRRPKSTMWLTAGALIGLAPNASFTAVFGTFLAFLVIGWILKDAAQKEEKR